MSQLTALPPSFVDLASYATTWGELATTEERYAKRQITPIAELRRFYADVEPRLVSILDHVDRADRAEPLNDTDLRLYRIALSLIEVAEAVEIFGQPAVPHIEPGRRVDILWSAEA
jgi:hypothetical protein